MSQHLTYAAFPYVILAHAVAWDRRISLGALGLYIILLARSLDKKKCFASVNCLAKDLGIGSRTVKDYLAQLGVAGLIERKIRYRRSAITQIVPWEQIYAKDTGAFTSVPLVFQDGASTGVGPRPVHTSSPDCSAHP